MGGVEDQLVPCHHRTPLENWPLKQDWIQALIRFFRERETTEGSRCRVALELLAVPKLRADWAAVDVGVWRGHVEMVTDICR